jgi:Predicted Zn peptidase
MAKSPEAYAFEIHRTLKAAFGNDAYPLRMRDVITQFTPIHAPGVSVEVVSKSLESLDGALIASTDKQSFTILVNSNIGSHGRTNFTLAHEFGHLLLHRCQKSQFLCGSKDVLGLTQNEVEMQANRFASQLLLPNNLVREVADKSNLSLSDVKDLSSRTGASLSAAALAIIQMSTRPIGFAVIRDGFVCWGRSSEAAYRAGLYFKSNQAVPDGSAAAFEGGDRDMVFPLGVGIDGWSTNDRWKEEGFYSAHYLKSYFLFTI